MARTLSLWILALFAFSFLEMPLTADSNPPFIVFDALTSAYKQGKPDLIRAYGLKPIHIIYSSQIFGHGAPYPDEPDPSDRDRLATLAKDMDSRDPGSVVCLDIEHWHWRTREEAIQTLRKLRLELAWFKQAGPSLKVGYYGIVPVPDAHLGDANVTSSRIRLFQERSQWLAPLAKNVDILFPSLYTFTDSAADWQRYADETLQEAKRDAAGKPVYAFVWGEFAGTGKWQNQFLPGDFWRHEIEFVRTHADGMILWAGAGSTGRSKDPWNEDWPWWQETKKFLKNNPA